MVTPAYVGRGRLLALFVAVPMRLTNFAVVKQRSFSVTYNDTIYRVCQCMTPNLGRCSVGNYREK